MSEGISFLPIFLNPVQVKVGQNLPMSLRMETGIRFITQLFPEGSTVRCHVSAESMKHREESSGKGHEE